MTNPQYFIAVQPSGDCTQYSKGDVVVRNDITYIAKTTPILCLPPENKNSGWEPVSNQTVSISFFNSISVPDNVKSGDEWFNPNTGKLYKYIVDVDSAQWVEIY